MKKIIFSFLLISFLSQTIFAQLQWHIQCTGRPLTSINFISPTKAWIFGSDISYKSSDGGVSWSNSLNQNPPIGTIPVYGWRTPSLVFFIDSLKGWACQYDNKILRTSNGGNTWSIINTGISSIMFQTIFFANSNIGWVGGYSYNPQSNIFKTTNGGLNWFPQNSNSSNEITTIFMINSEKGFYGSLFSDTIGYTTDGGNNWSKRKVGNGQGVRKIIFGDSLNGWVCGYSGYVSRTSNGGNSWTISTFYAPGNILNSFFLDNLTGWLTGSYGYIMKTTNGGVNWILIRGYQGGSPYNDLLDIYFKDENSGWVSGYSGLLLKSTNGGNNWFSIIEPPHGIIDEIYFANKFTGWAASNNSDDGYLSKTTNGGNNWINHLKFNNMYLYALHFVNANTGFASGSLGKIFKTVDGGQNWDSSIIGNYSYNSIHFVGAGTGWICGNSGQILKTTNTGLNWINQASGTSYNLNSVQFLNVSTGYIVGDSGIVLKTVNSGLNWIISQPINNYSYKDLYFLNISTGWAVGNKPFGSGMYWGTEKVVIKTSNGGINWNLLYSNSSMYQSASFMSVQFIDSQTGWVATKYNGILKTTNGGLNWFSDSSPLNNDMYCSIFFIDNETGWIAGGYNTVGYSGTILTTGNFPIGVRRHENTTPSSFSLSQNYPNPFNPVTKIKYQIPIVGQRHAFDVRLVIYDILGREIETLVNDTQRPGSYEVEWDGSRYASGVYFYRLMTDDPSTSSGQGYVETKKMVLIK